MESRRTVLCLSVAAALSAVITLLSLLWLSAPATAAPLGPPAVAVSPAAVRPGAEVHVTGFGFSPDGGYFTYLRASAVAEPPFAAWIPVTADAKGRVYATLALSRTAAPGGYAAVVRTHPIVEPQVFVTAALQVLPPIALTLDPAAGPPGTEVAFSATNLAAGMLRLDYDAVPLLGPLPVAVGTFSGTFTVPGDRPLPLGAATAVRVTNLANGTVAGVTEAGFGSQAPPAPPIYSFADVVVSPAGRLMPGEAFTVTGRIVPPPSGPQPAGAPRTLVAPASGSHVTAMGQSPGGQTAPVGEASVGAGGVFVLHGRAPSQLLGDLWSAADENPMTLVLAEPRMPDLGTHTLVISGPVPLVLTVAVQELGSGIPISNVLVVLGPAVARQADRGAYSHQSQLTAHTEGGIFSEDSLMEAIQCSLSRHAGLTDDSGQLTADIDPVDTVVYPVLERIQDQEAFYGINVAMVEATAGELATREAEAPAWDPPAIEPWERYQLTVDGLRVCYGVPDGAGGALPRIYKETIYYNPLNGALRDGAGSDIVGLHQVFLSPLDPDQCEFVGSNLRLEPGDARTRELLPGSGSPEQWDVFWGFHSFRPVQNDPLVQKDLVFPPVAVTFDVSQFQATRLISSRLYLDGTYLGRFTSMTVGGDLCGEPGEVVRYSYNLDPGDFAYWAEGVHALRVELDYDQGGTAARYIGMRLEPLPAWFLDPTYQNRAAYGAYHSQIRGELHPPAAVLSANVPRVGQEDNEASARTTVIENLGSSGSQIASTLGSEALNTPGQPQNALREGAGPLTIPDATVTIVDTGRIPVYRSTWGIWPIASAQFGCDIAFHADTTYGGTIWFDPHGGADTEMHVTPAATANVDMWLDVSMLCGLVEGSVHALPDITLNMPIAFQNEQKTDLGACFNYNLSASYYGKVGCCWCKLCKRRSGVTSLFSGSTCGALAAQPCPAVDAAQPDAVTEASPVLAGDGLGHMHAVYMTANGSLLETAWNGLAWDEPIATGIPTTTSPSGWQRADYAPDRAMLVWSASGWSEADWDSPSNTITAALRSRYIAYALWNGVSWSAPMTLTNPSTGDGNVALAACPSTDPGCPAGGAVTAVWLHDQAGDPTQRDWQLRYATYEGGAWSEVQPVDPPSSTTDSQQDVVYAGSVPLAAWVRDLDGNVATEDDRRVALRRLEEGASTELPAQLPGGVVELSLAVNANGQPRLAFTRLEEYAPGLYAGLLDNRHDLYSASVLEIQAGVDTGDASRGPAAFWAAHRLIDNLGRPIRAERPDLLIDGQNRATAVFRGLGFGPTPAGEYLLDPSETVGMATGAGELAMVEIDFQGTPHSPVYLTDDGAGYFSPHALYDPASDSIFSVAVTGASLPHAAQAKALRAAALTQQDAGEGAVLLASVPRLPDFTVVTATVTDTATLWTHKGVQVQVRNDGVAWQGSVTATLNLLASWDGGPGLGQPAGSAQLTSLASGTPVTVTLLVDAPAVAALPHTLYVTVNPTQTVEELDGTDNAAALVLPGLPAPQGVRAFGEPSVPLVFLRWDDPEDARVAGYRVYRTEEGGDGAAVGTTPITGFVDLNATAGRSYQYTVTSYISTGVESAGSAAAAVTLVDWHPLMLPVVLRAAG